MLGEGICLPGYDGRSTTLGIYASLYHPGRYPSVYMPPLMHHEASSTLYRTAVNVNVVGRVERERPLRVLGRLSSQPE